MRLFLKSTTSMTLVVAMSMPHIALAQDACSGGTFPCVTEDGTVMQSPEELQSFVAAQDEAAAEVAQQAADAAAAAQAEADAVAAAQAETDSAEAEADAAAQAEADAAAATVAEAAAAAQAEADAAAAQAEADAAAAAQAETDAAAQAEADAAQAEADAAAAAQAEADAAAAAQAEADAAAADEAESASEPESAAAETPAASAEAPAETTPEAEPEAQTSEAQPAEPTAEETAAATAAAEEQSLRDQIRAELLAERAQEQANSQAATAGDDSAGEVETETLTEEDVRTSDEEFTTAVTGAAPASEERSGLSNFEKALILGLGAVAVGSVLNNGDEVRSTSGDRVVVERDGELRVLKNDDALLRRAGNDIRTETFDDGSSRTIVEKDDGTRVVTIRGADGTVLRRVRVLPDGQEFTLFDDTQVEREIVVSQLPPARFASQMAGTAGEAELRAALQVQSIANQGAAFSLRQVRDISQVRALAAEIELDAVRFATGSAAIQPEQARSLARIGNTLREIIAEDPRTVLLVEGHTDAVGDATYNLALSDRRAETVALALTEYFGVPEENMIVQGYGESQLKVQTEAAEQANRRAVVRNITQLLR